MFDRLDDILIRYQQIMEELNDRTLSMIRSISAS